jgi:hypothetical protein
MSQTVLVAIVTAIVAILTSGALWAALIALLSRLRFDGIVVDTIPGTEGAAGLYRDAVRGFSIRIKVVNVTSSPAAIEWIAAFLPLKPKPSAPPVHAAFGEYWPNLVEDGARGSSLTQDVYPIVVAGDGGERYLELHVAMQYYRKMFPIWPYYWKDLVGLDIDDPSAPTDPAGNPMYDNHFEVGPVQLRLQINNKMRTLSVGTRGWWGVLPKARLPGIMAPRTTQPPIPLPPTDDNITE